MIVNFLQKIGQGLQKFRKFFAPNSEGVDLRRQDPFSKVEKFLDLAFLELYAILNDCRLY